MNVSKILGESEPEFSEQFKGVLTLMSGLRDLSERWPRLVRSVRSEITRDKMFIRSVADLAHQHVKKYGRSQLTDNILEVVEGRVMILNHFWPNLLEDVAFDTIKAINSGQLEPHGGILNQILMGHSLGFSITSEETPESLPVMTAIANATDIEIDRLYDIV
jgi:hypothetical protein